MEKNKSFSTDDEFDDEESKMEKFYDLIRRFNEARAHHQQRNHQLQTKLPRINHNRSNRNSNCSGGDNNRKEDLIKSESGGANLTIPCFKSEDFSEVYRHLHLEDEDQNVVSGKSGINFTESGKNIVEKYGKKRKIDEIEVDDNNGDYDYDEISFADQLKNSPHYETRSGLDLNLAL